MQQSSIVRCFFFVCLAGSAGACVTPKAAAVREPLIVPPAPPRVIPAVPDPPEEKVIPEPEPVPQLPRASRTRENRPEQKPQGTPPESNATGTGAGAAAPSVTGPAAAPPAVPAQGSAGSPELRTVEMPDDGKATRQVRDTLERATRTLSGIDYGRLSKPAQIQYDMAKRFIEQSDEALRARNYTAAQLMAEKAETIARELSGR